VAANPAIVKPRKVKKNKVAVPAAKL